MICFSSTLFKFITFLFLQLLSMVSYRRPHLLLAPVLVEVAKMAACLIVGAQMLPESGEKGVYSEEERRLKIKKKVYIIMRNQKSLN